jgi:hypothetical protein
LLNTPKAKNINILDKVKILAMYDNPQITKAPGFGQKLRIKKFSKLSMLVGISEAIRLLPTLSILVKLFKNYILQQSKPLFNMKYDCNNSIAIAPRNEVSESMDSASRDKKPLACNGQPKEDKENEERFYE